jgi:ubiquinone biosynthesis protein COQ9
VTTPVGAVQPQNAHFTHVFEKFQKAAIAEIRTQNFLPKGRHPVITLHEHKKKKYALVQIVTTEMLPGTIDQPYPELAVIHLDTKRPIPTPFTAIVIDEDPIHFE